MKTRTNVVFKSVHDVEILSYYHSQKILTKKDLKDYSDLIWPSTALEISFLIYSKDFYTTNLVVLVFNVFFLKIFAC